MSVWAAFFLVVSIVILASPLLLVKPAATGDTSDRGSRRSGDAMPEQRKTGPGSGSTRSAREDK